MKKAVTGKGKLRKDVHKEAYGRYQWRQKMLAIGQSWSESIDHFVEIKRTRLKSEDSLKWYLNNLKSFTNWIEEKGYYKITPVNLTHYTLDEYFNDLIDRGLTKRTVNAKRQALQQLYNILVRDGIVDNNPVNEVAPWKEEEPEIHSFKISQVKKIFDQMPVDEWTGARDYSALRMIFETGCRVNEALNLKMNQLNWKEGKIVSIYFPPSIAKNSKSRVVAVTSKLDLAIRNWLTLRNQYGVSDDETDYIHIGMPIRDSDPFKPFNKRNLGKNFRRYCQEAGVDKSGIRCSPYTLKHTFCMLFLQGGGRFNSLRKIVGHIDEKSYEIHSFR